MSDYVDDFLFHTALYENALETPLTDEAKKRRLLQSLSGRDEILLVNLAMNLQLDIFSTFGDIVTKLRLFDLTQFGQDRILGKKSKNANEVICVFCKLSGHTERNCRRKKRTLQKVGISVSAVAEGKSGGRSNTENVLTVIVCMRVCVGKHTPTKHRKVGLEKAQIRKGKAHQRKQPPSKARKSVGLPSKHRGSLSRIHVRP
jgi:hypothetical protein